MIVSISLATLQLRCDGFIVTNYEWAKKVFKKQIFCPNGVEEPLERKIPNLVSCSVSGIPPFQPLHSRTHKEVG
jgi:hypothetical protein